MIVGMAALSKYLPKFNVDIDKLAPILLVDAYEGKCPDAPLIRIERELSYSRVKEVMDSELSADEFIFFAEKYDILKKKFIDGDVILLGDMVSRFFDRKVNEMVSRETSLDIIKVEINKSRLYQVIEIDWTLQILPFDNNAICYEIYTKRDIFLKEDND